MTSRILSRVLTSCRWVVVRPDFIPVLDLRVFST